MAEKQILVKVCQGTACSRNLSRYTLERAQREQEFLDLKNVEIQTCPCQGNCEDGPTVVAEQDKKKKVLSHTSPAEMGKLLHRVKETGSIL